MTRRAHEAQRARTGRWIPWSGGATTGATEGPLVHHRARGVRCLLIRCTERLADAGIEPSVGSRGDSCDNALAEPIIGLEKAEVIDRDAPRRGLAHVELATLEWVCWFNTVRLLEQLSYVRPAEFDVQYHTSTSDVAELVLKYNSLLKSRTDRYTVGDD